MIICMSFASVLLRAGPIILFSPQDKPTNMLLKLINEAQKTILAAVYMFTENRIAQALIKARQRNVEIKIIVDRVTVESEYGKALLLLQNGIEVSMYTPFKAAAVPYRFLKQNGDKFFPHESIMHNKFAIFDNKTVFTGSFNWTVSANVRNQENVIVIEDADVCKIYETYFDKLFTTQGKKLIIRSAAVQTIDKEEAGVQAASDYARAASVMMPNQPVLAEA